MTDEEIKALQDAKEAAERRAADAAALAEAARVEAEKSKTDLQGLVEELKVERQKKNEALSKVNINNSEPVDISSAIEQALKAKEDERRQKELEEAIAEFKSSKSEFQADAAGLVFDKFKSTLGKFNLSDIQTKEQAKSRLEEIYRFANFKEAGGQELNYDGTPQNGYSVPDNGNKLTRDVENVIESARMDTDKFTKLKNKYPEALSGLGI